MKFGRFVFSGTLLAVSIFALGADDLLKPVPPTTSPSTSVAATQKAFDPAKVKITINTSEAPELDDWAQHTLKPVLQEWYPKICAQLPVDGYTPPDHFSVTFRKDFKGVAWTMNQRIEASAKWIEDNLKGESLGAIVHEEVHVVQNPFFGRQPRGTPNHRIPGWLLEGSCDYIRWFQYEPVDRRRKDPNPDKVKYNDAYFPTAHFLVFVANKYDKNIVTEMNAANRKGTYSVDLWKQYTGKTIDELSDEWKDSLRKNRPSTKPV
jgi:hypothetical protein